MHLEEVIIRVGVLVIHTVQCIVQIMEVLRGTGMGILKKLD